MKGYCAHHCEVPQVHSHMATLTVRRSREIGIIEPRFILDGDCDSIITPATSTKIVALKVERLLRETISDRKYRHEHDSVDQEG